MSAARPNIIFIVADDLGFADLGCYGGRDAAFGRVSPVIDQLAANDASDIVVFGGGIIPEGDIPALEAMGVAKVFTPGTTTQSIVDWVVSRVGAPA